MYSRTGSIRSINRCCDGLEGQIVCARSIFSFPEIEEAAVTERQIRRTIHGEASSCSIDPLRRAFQFGVIADRSLVDHAVSFAIAPLAAPLLISERGYKADRLKQLGQSRAI